MSKIEGVAKKFDGTAIDYVSIFNWADGKCITQVTPDVVGSWAYNYYNNADIGVTYVANGCEPITHGPYELRTWTPISLFDAGQYGVWYDLSDMSTLFQDAEGTIPVTSSAQPVGLILDKSGNNNNALQPVANRRPAYYTDGVTHFLRFDGVDDFLDVPHPPPIPPSERAFFLAVDPIDTGAEGSWFFESYGPGSGAFFLSLTAGVFNPDNSNPIRFVSYFHDKRNDAPNISYYGQKSVFSSINTATSIELRQNSEVIDSIIGGTYNPQSKANSGFYIGRAGKENRFFKGDMYDIVFIVKDLNETEVSDVEQYLAIKSAV